MSIKYIHSFIHAYIRRKEGLTFGYVAQEAIVILVYAIMYYIIIPLLNWKTRCTLKFDLIQKRGKKRR